MISSNRVIEQPLYVGTHKKNVALSVGAALITVALTTILSLILHAASGHAISADWVHVYARLFKKGITGFFLALVLMVGLYTTRYFAKRSSSDYAIISQIQRAPREKLTYEEESFLTPNNKEIFGFFSLREEEAVRVDLITIPLLSMKKDEYLVLAIKNDADEITSIRIMHARNGDQILRPKTPLKEHVLENFSKILRSVDNPDNVHLIVPTA